MHTSRISANEEGRLLRDLHYRLGRLNATIRQLEQLVDLRKKGPTMPIDNRPRRKAERAA